MEEGRIAPPEKIKNVKAIDMCAGGYQTFVLTGIRKKEKKS
jgi:hypothetical protein